MNNLKAIKEIEFTGIPVYLKAKDILENVLLYANRKPNKYVTIDKLLYLYPFVSRKRVYEMIRHQGLKHIEGKPILIDTTDFEEFLENQKVINSTTIEQEYNKKYGLLNIPVKKKKFI